MTPFPHRFRADAPARTPPSRTAWASLLASLALAVATAPAHAGRPLATEDASLMEAGACHVETWLERTANGHAFWAMPACNPLGMFELALGGARARSDGGPHSTVGAWQIKTVFEEASENGPGFGLALAGQRERQGPGSTEFKAIATWPLRGDDLLLHTNLGWLRERGGDLATPKSRATWALALDQAVGERIRVSAESFSATGQRARWQLGLSYELVPDHVQIDASLGSAFGRWGSTRTVTLGMVFTSPVFLR